MARGSHQVGGKNESHTWEYLKPLGYIRPERKQRANIVAAFAQHGLAIRKSGFDVVAAEHAAALNSADELARWIDQFVLYEVKACGIKHGAKVSPGFSKLGFTLTSNERHNAELLGNRFRFLFVNLNTRFHRECSLLDFFIEGRARIIPTWSVFLTHDLPPQIHAEPSAAADRGRS